MDKLHKSSKNDAEYSAPEEGLRRLLCSNEVSYRSPSFGLQEISSLENDALECLAGIIVEAFIESRRHETKQR